jgi:SAM-dependent methyltransferase
MDRDYELQTHRAEDRHWWYRGRRNVLEGVIADLRLPTPARILDAGCGSGRNMLELAHHGSVTGVELSHTSAGLARARHAGDVIEGSVMQMPFPDDSFDLAVSLDVIEHLEDDRAALAELRRVVTPDGALLVTVPAYPWLWSGHDEINHHHRRYTDESLLRVAEQAGWECTRTTHFNSLLLPVAIVLRVMDRLSRKTTESSLDLWVPPRPLNWLLERPLALEAALIGRGRRIPAGLSLLAVFEPSSHDDPRAQVQDSERRPRAGSHWQPEPIPSLDGPSRAGRVRSG